jgi:hypothetical protein
MSKRSLFAVMVFFALGFSVSAQEAQRPERVQRARLTLNQAGAAGLIGTSATDTRLFGTLNSVWYGPAALTLADGRLFTFPSAFAWIEPAPVDFMPAMLLAEPPRVTPAATLTENPARPPVDLLPRVDYVGGEVGGFYGKSFGKNGLEVKGGYIQSEIIEGNTYINFSASYEESSGRLLRRGR